MTAWLASDLHLDPSTPEIAGRFRRFLAGPVRGAEALFLLGDLFEAWIGDDDPEPAHREVIAAIAAAAAAGTRVFVMRGNRDFMIGERFCAESGATLLDDPSVVTIAGERVLLTHGDGLCTDDRAYQRLRALVNDPGLRVAFARLPIEARRRLAAEARAGVGVMIHGHTHRPGVHRHAASVGEHTRVVLGAWHDEAHVLRWDANGWKLLPCPA